MDLRNPDEPSQESFESTKNDMVFSLIKMILGNLFNDQEHLTIEYTRLLLNTAIGIRVEEPIKLIKLEEEVEQQDVRLNVNNKGLATAGPDIQVPFRIFCSFDQRGLFQFFKPDITDRRTLQLPRPLTHLFFPLLLHDAVFSLRVHSATPSGSKHPIGSGRGFMVFESP